MLACAAHEDEYSHACQFCVHLNNAVLAEREACAKLAEAYLEGPYEASDATVRAIAADIRARS